MPFQHFLSPSEQWARLPTFFIGEWVFIALALALLVHAIRTDRAHLLLWVGALVAGTANDLIFMALPMVDNFWHSQASVMLTARLPLYIPCVYVCFMYLPAVAARRAGLPLASTAALTGLLAVLFYAPFDITGAKYLWWTWHDTDLPVATRLLGAPTSSTLWVLTFSGSYALLLGAVLRKDPEVSARTFALGLAVVALCATVVMVVQITVLQQLDGGAPGYFAIGVGLTLYAIAAARGARKAEPRPVRRLDALAWTGAVVYHVALVACVGLFDPSAHTSVGVHQELGECHVEATDIAGLTRYQFLCATDYEEDFELECGGETPEPSATWYRVCGREHRDFGLWLGAVLGLGLLSSALLGALFFARRKPRGG